MSLERSYDLSIPWYGFEKTPYGALRYVEGTPEALSFSEWENTSSGDPTDYYFASVSGGEPAGGVSQYPIDNPYVSSDYGTRNGEMHNGVDLVNKQKGAVDGKPVYSVTDGKVVRLVTTPDGNRAGVRVRIQAPNGYQYNYFHLQDGSNSHLQYNMTINKGDFIGNVGNTGGSRGAHLHFEIWAPNGTKVNPYDVYPALYNIPHR